MNGQSVEAVELANGSLTIGVGSAVRKSLHEESTRLALREVLQPPTRLIAGTERESYASSFMGPDGIFIGLGPEWSTVAMQMEPFKRGGGWCDLERRVRRKLPGVSTEHNLVKPFLPTYPHSVWIGTGSTRRPRRVGRRGPALEPVPAEGVHPLAVLGGEWVGHEMPGHVGYGRHVGGEDRFPQQALGGRDAADGRDQQQAGREQRGDQPDRGAGQGDPPSPAWQPSGCVASRRRRGRRRASCRGRSQRRRRPSPSARPGSPPTRWPPRPADGTGWRGGRPPPARRRRSRDA